MIYYKRLIKNKAYKAIIGMIIITALGAFVSYISLESFIKEGLQFEGYYVNNKFGWLTSTNIGILPLGIFIMHLGMVFFPVCSKYAQDLSEYKVNADKEYIWIEFRKYKWKIRREKFSDGSSLMFFDDNRNFVTMTRGYQVYNAIWDCEALKLAQCTDKNNIALIPNAELLTATEKNMMCKKLKLNKNNWFIKGFSIMFYLIGISSFGLPTQVLDPKISNIILAVIFGSLMGVFFIIMGYNVFQMSCEGKKEYNYISSHDVFKVRVYSYDKKNASKNDCIKICDGNELFFDEWYTVTRKQFDNAENIKWYAYYYVDKKGIYKIRVLEEVMT